MKPSARIVTTIVFLMAQLCMVRAQSSEIGLEPLSQHDPDRKVLFTVRFQEDASLDGASWSTAVEARYALMPAWDGVRTFGAVAPGSITSEEFFGTRGGFSLLEPKEFLQFYMKEQTAEGKGSSHDGSYSWSWRLKDGVVTETACGHTSRWLDSEFADVSDAQFERTERGATLVVRYVGGTRCDMGAGADILGFTPDEADRLLKFELTSDELRNWPTIHKVNQGTIRGHGDDPALNYPVRVRVALITSSVPEDAPLEAKPKAPASVARGASVKLDGSDSTGDIKEYRWTFAPAAAGAEINAQVEKSGKEVEVVLLASTRITLEVADGKQKKRKSVTVTVEPRDWKTTITHLPDEGDLDEKAPFYDPLRPSGWIGGENVCSIDPPAGPHDTTHILHPKEEGGTWNENGYALAEVSDPNGPYDGFWYPEKWEVRITRRTLVNKYIREEGPVIFGGMTENFFTANVRLGMAVRQYLQAARDHERKHTTLVEEALAKDDPAKKVEKAYARGQEAARRKADEILRISEQALSDATKDPLPRMWQGRVMIPNAATYEWIGVDTDI
jgi:hypothetical protein